ncbi:hypothetical protein BFP76_12810 [Amylibacter kogurei]|uniref:Endonuclease GajA/Old nuclease/RecF-like AAA domain-containing protein n=1 Tax=Paramylibacter kogurei TaxID=1889778 RepID=A0A2G5K8L2_9RHOB|nr:AAA family ATPase [Amylibacter kogurei]PIB25877.1 hypothetical protein BFP76_12810 [Amylibacter kogurei]
MTDSMQTNQISSVKIRGLFKRFNHEIVLQKNDLLTIVTAPNGFGKTAVLRAVDAFFNRKFSFFWRTMFSEIIFKFENGQRISIYKEFGTLFEDDSTESSIVYVKGEGFENCEEPYALKPKIPRSSYSYLERSLPVDRVGADRWIDFPSEEILSTSELVARYVEQLPEELTKSIDMPIWLQEITQEHQVSLIETQRLLALEESHSRHLPRHSRPVKPDSVVEKDASDLAEKINRVLQQYANESQKLDQTFPKRIIESHGSAASTESDIRERLLELSASRQSLVDVGIIDEAVSEPIQPSQIFEEDNVRRILSIYADDTQTKLSVFSDIYDRIRLFKEILDEYFTFKEVRISSENGIIIVDSDTGEQIPLAELSSGEQHELVLVYELLFKVKEGALILIDEPELSLHVAWQKRFISDLLKIQSLRHLSVVIATHSPQIIHDNWDLVQELSRD